ncbi:hypothetical protein RHS01_04570 [Rhizoctonia solani]|uniref:Uncharacterized protein n=1 Tax=Rhizoctonia solani TaxID=456999 RepID=A0A8H7IDP1_9AGAM|nr:hypothetical protein RHS01_04570 [Rhizoctonia solani]
MEPLALPPSSPPPADSGDGETTPTTPIAASGPPRPASPAFSVAETTRAGGSSNRQGRSSSGYNIPDQTSINNLVNGFTATSTVSKQIPVVCTRSFNTWTQRFESQSPCSHAKEVDALGPPPDAAAQIHKLRLQLRAQDKKQEARIADIKHIVKDVLKEQIAEHMRPQIQEQIRLELRQQIQAAVKEQISEHLPVSLQDQADESKRQLIEVRNSLLNRCVDVISRGSSGNATLRSTNLDDALAPVVKANGEESALAPQTLRQLFSYDSAQARALVRDYGLREHDVRERNLNRFMAHIGVQFNLIPIPVMVDGVVDENGAPIGVTLI